LLAFSSVNAEDLPRPNYTYLELDYIYASAEINSEEFLPDVVNESTVYIPDGFAVRGSAVLFEQLLVRGSYYAGKGEFKSTTDVSASTGVISAGWLPATDDAAGIDVTVDYRTDSFEYKSSPKYDEDIGGVGVSFGVRATPFRNSEFGIRLGWYEGDYNGSIGYQVNAAYNFTDRFGINVLWDNIDADVNKEKIEKFLLNQVGIGARLYF
jgi:hypothetical protein